VQGADAGGRPVAQLIIRPGRSGQSCDGPPAPVRWGVVVGATVTDVPDVSEPRRTGAGTWRSASRVVGPMR